MAPPASPAAALPLGRAPLLGLFLTVLAGCSREEASPWPTRNYSGVYAVRARVRENTCSVPVFTPADTLVVTVVQSPENVATLEIVPIAILAGAFRGDALEARAAVRSPFLPPAPAGVGAGGEGGARRAAGDTGSAATAGAAAARGGADSSAAEDSLRYVMRLEFEGTGFVGTYWVEQPGMGENVQACRQEFTVTGSRIQDLPRPATRLPVRRRVTPPAGTP